MSTYGGDSWLPEAMHRKRQVDQVLVDVHQLDKYSNQLRRLSDGRIACLVCSHHPVLETFPMLIIHRKGAKHQAAAVKYEEKDFRLQNEIRKRTALEASKATEIACSSQKRQSSSKPACSPLLDATRKRTAEALALPDDSKATSYSGTVRDVPCTKQKIGLDSLFISAKPLQVVKISSNAAVQHPRSDKRKQGQRELEPKPKVGLKEDQDRRKERERILRLREAGWRLDGNGKWFKDESVEFDSDEEVPADVL